MNMRLPDWQAWIVPLASGFVLASVAVALIVPSHTHPLSLPGLVSRSTGMIALAGVVACVSILVIWRALREYFGQIPSGLIACGWSAAIWLPLLLLLQTEHALWVILAPIPIAAIVTRHTKRQVLMHRIAEIEGNAPEVTTGVLFQAMRELQPKRVTPNAVLSALLLQACIVAAAVRALALAESLLIVTTGCFVWSFTAEVLPSETVARSEARRRRASVIPCFLLTCLAMTPFLLAGSAAGALGSVVLAGARIPTLGTPRPIMGMAYSGVVLLAPPLPKRKHLEIPTHSLQKGSLERGRPLVIPFDGAYWFFEPPNSRPGSDSPTQRGDPIKNLIRSTNYLPLKMEAHQHLGERINASCCSGLEIHLTNADNRLGVIEVEAVLRDVRPGSTFSRSLGTVPIRSSQARVISLYRTPKAETLRFSMSGADDFRFNEITLIFHQGHERDRANAHVKVSDFTLIP